MHSVKVGQHYELIRPSSIGRSTFTVIAIEGEKVIVQGAIRRTIKLSSFTSHKRQYRLLKDA